MDNIPIRLKYFRNRSRLSQMQLELEIDAAFGSISRMEAGKVNPTKETVLKIAKVLDLSDRELDYLIGPSNSPASPGECNAAQEEVREYFSKKGVIAYLVDDRYRLIAFSNSLAKIFDPNHKEQRESLLFKTLPELLLNPAYPTAKFFNSDLEHNLKLLLSRFHNEMGFMQDDECFKKIMEMINGNQVAKRIWKQLQEEKERIVLFPIPDRLVYFKVAGVRFKMHYANEQLQKFKRFDVVEYIPNNWFIKTFSKFF